MYWFILVVAGLFETGFAFCLGQARLHSGLGAALWWIGFAVSLVVSMALLYKASLHIPIGTAYAVWTGIGAVGIVILGILVFKEPAGFWRLFFITTLIASIVGLRVVAS
jgi:quaternary ammonium compound-resistance protein SugE